MKEILLAVLFFNMLFSYNGSKLIEVPLPKGANFRQLKEYLVNNVLSELKSLLFHYGEFKQHKRYFINKKLILDKTSSTSTKDSNKLMIFPMMVGGCYQFINF